MSLKERLVNRDRFDPDTFGFTLEADNPIDHQERKTVRQNLHYLVGVESAITTRNRPRHRQSASLRLLAGDSRSQVRIRSMTGFYRHDMTANAPPDQCKIAN